MSEERKELNDVIEKCANAISEYDNLVNRIRTVQKFFVTKQQRTYMLQQIRADSVFEHGQLADIEACVNEITTIMPGISPMFQMTQTARLFPTMTSCLNALQKKITMLRKKQAMKLQRLSEMGDEEIRSKVSTSGAYELANNRLQAKLTATLKSKGVPDVRVNVGDPESEVAMKKHILAHMLHLSEANKTTIMSAQVHDIAAVLEHMPQVDHEANQVIAELRDKLEVSNRLAAQARVDAEACEKKLVEAQESFKLELQKLQAQILDSKALQDKLDTLFNLATTIPEVTAAKILEARNVATWDETDEVEAEDQIEVGDDGTSTE